MHQPKALWRRRIDWGKEVARVPSIALSQLRDVARLLCRLGERQSAAQSIVGKEVAKVTPVFALGMKIVL